MKSLRTFLSLAAALLLLAGCATTVTEYNSAPLTVGIPVGVNQDAVLKAMHETFTGRDWKVDNQSRNTVTGTLKHKNYTTTVTMESNGRTVLIYVKDSKKIDTKDGVPVTVPEVPVGYVENLRNDLSNKLAKAQQGTAPQATGKK